MFSSRLGTFSAPVRRGRVRATLLLVLLVSLFCSGTLVAQNNHAIGFDGIDGWLDLGSRSSFDFRVCFTLEAWIRPTALGDTVGIVGNYRRDLLGGSGHSLVLDSAGRPGLILAHDIGATDAVWSPDAITLGVWTHVAGNWDGRNLRLFIDGVEVASTVVDDLGVLWTLDNAMSIGRFDESPRGFFSGQVDEVRMWNVCRSAGELRFNQHLRLAADATGLVSYLRLDEGSGGTTSDDVEAGGVATLRGSAMWEVSDVNVGIGRSAQSSATEPSRAHYFDGTDVRVDFPYATARRPLMITSLLDQSSDDSLPDVSRLAQRAWIVYPGADTFTVNMTLRLGRGAIGELDAANRENLRLYYQPLDNGDVWTPVGSTLAIDTTYGAVTFGPIVAGDGGIDHEGGRFIIGTTGDSRFDAPRSLALVSDLADVRTCAFGRTQLAVLADGHNLSYTWRKNGRAVAGAVGAELRFDRVTLEDDGEYDVTIVDQYGDVVDTRRARLHVVLAPRIVADPTDVLMTEGQRLELFSEIEGTDVEFQWQRNRIDIPGATSHTLVFEKIDTADAGYYRLLVRNECGEDQTVDVRVRVMRKPVPMSVVREEAPGVSIMIAPNPSVDRATVTITGITTTDDVTVTLVDARGNVVMSESAVRAANGDARATFDMSHLPAGTFLCRVTCPGGVSSATVLKAGTTP